MEETDIIPPVDVDDEDGLGINGSICTSSESDCNCPLFAVTSIIVSPLRSSSMTGGVICKLPLLLFGGLLFDIEMWRRRVVAPSARP